MTVRGVLALLAVLVAALAAVTLFRPPFPNGDFAGAMRAWDWWRSGGSFHHVPLPPIAGAAPGAESMLVWWSPGTYLPAAAAELLGLPLAWGMTAWLAAGTWLGLWGWMRVWRQLGHRDAVIALALLVVGLSWHALYGFRIYHGGELTRFAVLPWLWLAVGAQPAGSWRQALVLAGAILVAGIVKLSLLVALVGLGLFQTFAAPRRLPALVRLGAAGVAAALLLHLLWLGRGESPGSAHAVPALPTALNRVGLAFTLPASAVFAHTSVAGRMGDAWFGGARPESSTPWLLALIGLAAALYAAAWRGSPTPRSQHALVALGGATIAVLGVLFARGSAVNFEDRHARDAALLLVPALVAFALAAPRPLRWPLLGALAGSMAWGVASLTVAWAKPTPAPGPRGLPLWDVPAPVAARVAALGDEEHAGETVVVTPVSELSLHLPRARVFPTLPLDGTNGLRPPARVIYALPPGPVIGNSPAPAVAPATWREESLLGWTIRHVTLH